MRRKSLKKYNSGGYKDYYTDEPNNLDTGVDFALTATSSFTPTGGKITQLGKAGGDLAKNTIGADTVEGNMAGKAIQYGAAGAEIGNMAGPYGAAIGAGIGVAGGAAMGAVNYEKNMKEARKLKEEDDAKRLKDISDYSTNVQSRFERNRITKDVYSTGGRKRLKDYTHQKDGHVWQPNKNGGSAKDLIEVEAGEVMVGDKPKVISGGSVKKNSIGYEILGKKHNEGGVKVKVGNSFIFSDNPEIKIPTKTLDWTTKGAVTPAKAVKKAPEKKTLIAEMQEFIKRNNMKSLKEFKNGGNKNKDKETGVIRKDTTYNADKNPNFKSGNPRAVDYSQYEDKPKFEKMKKKTPSTPRFEDGGMKRKSISEYRNGGKKKVLTVDKYNTGGYKRSLNEPNPSVDVELMEDNSVLKTGNSSKRNSGFDADSFASGANKALPYLTTLANMSRKVPNPPKPIKQNRISLNKFDFTDQKIEADSQRSLLDKKISRGLTNSATAAAAKVGTLGQTISAKNNINKEEQRMNVQVGNQEEMVNQSIDAQNNQLDMAYNQDKFNQKLIQQGRTESGMNNLAQTSMMQGAERNAMDRDTLALHSTIAAYADSGVLARNPLLLESYKKSLINTGMSKDKAEEEVERMREESRLKAKEMKREAETNATSKNKSIAQYQKKYGINYEPKGRSSKITTGL